MDLNLFLEQFWKYYLHLEKEVMTTFEYSTLDKLNGGNFSFEYAKLLQTICSEIDVISKAYCEFLGSSGMNSIAKYASVITVARPDIKTMEVECLENRNCKYKPYKIWEYNFNTNKKGVKSTTGTPPPWWTIYNKVKHERLSMNNTYKKENYKLANQDNVMNAIAGLYLMEMFFYKDIVSSMVAQEPNIPLHRSILFELKNWSNVIVINNDFYAETIQ